MKFLLKSLYDVDRSDAATSLSSPDDDDAAAADAKSNEVDMNWVGHGSSSSSSVFFFFSDNMFDDVDANSISLIVLCVCVYLATFCVFR